MLDFILRAILMYLVALVVIRSMGKRALGELGLFDFVVMTGVGHILTSVALDQSLPFYEGVGVLVTLAAMEWLSGYLSIKNQRIARLISGCPVIMIENGRVIKENLSKEKFNVDDLLQELRKQGVRDIREVEKGILEPSGGFSIILRESFEPVTRGELGIKWEPDSDSLSTFMEVSRAEFFKIRPEEGEDKPVFPLVDGMERMERKLDAILARLEELERRP